MLHLKCVSPSSPSRELRQWIQKVNLNPANPKINYAYPEEHKPAA